MALRLPRVYIVDDEQHWINSLVRNLPRGEFDLVSHNTAESAWAALEKDRDVDVIVTDLQMPGMSGLELLKKVKVERPEIEVVLITAHGSGEIADRAMKAGAVDYLEKPCDSIRWITTVRNVVEHKRLVEEIDNHTRAPRLVASSAAMREVQRLVRAAAPAQASVLILGESGTGKELVARSIHASSARRQKPFLAVNCSALAESLLESELFGHVRGAFTGADSARAGIFESADGGTVFLDEIGDAPPSVQVKLLRVLQEGEIKRVGAATTDKVDVRVLAATNVDLEAAVKKGMFREDLYYRLNVVMIRVPPLRERREDVRPLALTFLARYRRELARDVTEIAPEAMAALERWSWPGNVRELENVIERALVLGRGARIEVDDLPDKLQETPPTPRTGAIDGYMAARQRALDEFERTYVEDLLERAGGNISEAARLAGLDRSNFKRILKRVGRG
jgi:DNA-binding NtrC family response regulator